HRRGSKFPVAAGSAASPGTAPVRQTSAYKVWCSTVHWSSFSLLFMLFIRYKFLSCSSFQPGQHRGPAFALFSLRFFSLRLGAALHVQQGVQLSQTGGFF